MWIPAMLKRFLEIRRDTMECTQEIERVNTAREPVAAPLRKKLEERRRESQPLIVTNGQGNGA